MAASDTTIVTARISAELKAKLDALARSTKRSKSHLATEAIAAYVEQNAWQIAEIEAGIAELDRGEVMSDHEVEALYERLTRQR
ncbi:MAG: ribbon-helix-helix protein, CopG family [Alphaproteobacteria bacterium]|nr:ribbon-helix-helix protein, CopG family [Alphaproteobacteria bacterium]